MKINHTSRWLIIVIVTIISISFNFMLHAQTSQLLNYQGKLTNKDGTPASGTYTIIFSIYSAAADGAALWDETRDVSVTNGVFNVLLGSIKSFPENLFTGTGNRYLGIKVGTDPEMQPRFQLASVAYAIKAFHSDIDYAYGQSNVYNETSSLAYVDTDVSITINADGSSSYLVQASCTVGHSMNNMVVGVAIFRGNGWLNEARQRVQYPEPEVNENVSLFHVDTPPAGLQTYKLKFRSENDGKAYIHYKRLLVMKLK